MTNDQVEETVSSSDDQLQRVVLGLVTVYEEPARSDGVPFHADQFARFERDPTMMGYPQLLAGHTVPFQDRERLGFWYAFRSVSPGGGVPDGLLGLGLFGESPAARAMTEHLAKDPTAWSLSVGCKDISDAEDRSELWMVETSLTKNPDIPSSRVLRVGAPCVDVWEMLTGSPMPLPPDLPTQTAYGAWVPVGGGRLQRETWQEPIL